MNYLYPALAIAIIFSNPSSVTAAQEVATQATPAQDPPPYPPLPRYPCGGLCPALDSFSFARGSATFKSEFQSELISRFGTTTGGCNGQIVVTGSADPSEIADGNPNIADKRVEVVVKALIKLGIDPARILKKTLEPSRGNTSVEIEVYQN